SSGFLFFLLPFSELPLGDRIFRVASLFICQGAGCAALQRQLYHDTMGLAAVSTTFYKFF
ncbi:MAG: hypothetical protein NC331_17760, partial [Lachnospiraceae bacterium]|nr:hypothetical protein [Lachnospiraceae bacterium]MCM1241190.1 hypothetical protein [Lachnospiraceae bacterium]